MLNRKGEVSPPCLVLLHICISLPSVYHLILTEMSEYQFYSSFQQKSGTPCRHLFKRAGWGIPSPSASSPHKNTGDFLSLQYIETSCA